MTAHAAASPSSAECLIWDGARDTHGRAQVCRRGKRYQVHRIVCEFAYGPPPTPKHEAAHLCHNGRGGCIRVEHLRWMTRAENIASQPGLRHHSFKLKAEQVREIRAWNGTETKAEVARRYGISPRLVGQIIKRERWWWLP